jgi:hypothetical protein
VAAPSLSSPFACPESILCVDTSLVLGCAQDQGVQYSPDGSTPEGKNRSPAPAAGSAVAMSPTAALPSNTSKKGVSVAVSVPVPARSEEQVLADIKAREKALLPVYHQVATAFADLHDTPGRMSAKGVIRRVVSWEHSRTFFYWRLRRRLAECAVVKVCHGTALSRPMAIVVVCMLIPVWLGCGVSACARPIP